MNASKKQGRSGPKSAQFRLEDQVGHLLRRAYQRASAHLADRLKPHDLTPMQFAALMRLRECGPLSQNELGRMISMPPANIHSMVGRLKKRGVLTTGRDPNDRRLILIDLSEEGARLTDALIPLDLQSSADALAPLAPAERKTFLALLRKLALGE